MNEIPHPGFDKPEKYETFTTTNDLEEAAEKYTQEMLESWKFDSTGCRPPRESFIAGAEWQKSQMLKEAVEGRIEEVSFNNGELHNTIFFSFDEESLYVENRIWFPRCGKDGDKVRIIICKKEDTK